MPETRKRSFTLPPQQAESIDAKVGFRRVRAGE